MEVLFEQTQEMDGQLYYVGHTRNYIKVAVKSEENIVNREMVCELTQMLTEDMVFAQKN